MTTYPTVVRARKMGIATLILLIPALVLEICLFLYPDILALELLVLLVGLAGVATYTLFIAGLVTIGKAQNSRLEKTATQAVAASAILGALLSFGGLSFLPEALLVIFMYAVFGAGIIFGIINIRIAKDLTPLEAEYGVVAKRAALWSKLSGWLMATVILSFIGAVLSVIADYYYWRLEGEFLRKQVSA